jgi:N-acylneuraminate cytidylyltransferase
VIKHALDYFDSIGEWYDNICLLQPTCPFREEGFIDKCIEQFVGSGADSLVSVRRVPHEYNPHWVFEPSADGFLNIATGEQKIIPSRQMLPEAYIRDGSVYLFKADNVRNLNNMYGNKITYLESTTPWHVNIDTPADWQQAERMAHLMYSMN